MEAVNNLYETRLDPTKKIEQAPILLSVNSRTGTQSIATPIFSYGDMSMIQGRQKSKKTFLTAAMCANLLNSESFDHKLVSEEDGKSVAIFDTEQSDYYAQKNNQRVFYLSMQKEFFYFALRDKNPTERKAMIEYFAKTHKDKVRFLLIDGIVDLLFDFNDLKECSNLVQWLMALTKETGIHICSILHENNSQAGAGKARGHIGTMLSQKVETVIRIEKNKHNPNASIISAADTRGRGFSPFEIFIDQMGNPLLRESEQQEEIF